jgi:hypothetical protein
MSQGLVYNVDIAFCVDVTGSMSPVIDLVKERVADFADDLDHRLRAKGKVASQIRARVIAFRDCHFDLDWINASDFQTLLPAKQTSEFSNVVSGLTAAGGGDEPESGLEALAVAMGSEWTQDGDRQRHIIVMFTDASAHPLGGCNGAVPSALATLIPSSIGGLTDIWEGKVSTGLKHASRRLLLFAPDIDPWSAIGDAWDKTVYLPSRAGDGLSEVEYETILDVCCNAV